MNKDPNHCELIVVSETGAAAGHLKTRRDRLSQAVLLLSGRMPFAHEDIADVLELEAVLLFIAAIGVGIDLGLGNSFTLEKVRYGRIVLCLPPQEEEQVIAFFNQYMNPLVRAGYVYTLTGAMPETEEDAVAQVLDSLTRQIARVNQALN